jgi:hypothetical protein
MNVTRPLIPFALHGSSQNILLKLRIVEILIMQFFPHSPGIYKYRATPENNFLFLEPGVRGCAVR